MTREKRIEPRVIKFAVFHDTPNGEEEIEDMMIWPPPDGGWFASWLSRQIVPPQLVTDEDRCRAVIAFFNYTRRPWEFQRTFVRLIEGDGPKTVAEQDPTEDDYMMEEKA